MNANFINPKLYEQFDFKLNLFSYFFQASLLSPQIDNFNFIKPDLNHSIKYHHEDEYETNTPGVFIFLIDQSGSMYGSAMNLAIESLKLFIKSLPKNSYFDIIGFGSTHEVYTENPYFYSQDNIDRIITIISTIEANLGGTEIYNKLNFVFFFLHFTNNKTPYVGCTSYFTNYNLHQINISLLKLVSQDSFAICVPFWLSLRSEALKFVDLSLSQAV